MRRRPDGSASPAVPEHLQRFHCPAASPWEAFGQWRRARWDHWRAHPDAWPNAVAVIAGGANVRAKLTGRQPPHPQHDEGGPNLSGSQSVTS